jgi:predicted NUDIX family NTP pyrophosphohydrolase
MAKKRSAGLLLFKRKPALQVFLVHPGGPFFKNKDRGAWSVPKGEIDDGEEPLDAAKREFVEEIGVSPGDEFLELGSVKQKGGKLVYAWACEGDIPHDHQLQSNVFEMEWPPRSGEKQQFPEIDRAEFFPLEEARDKINPAQVVFLDRLLALLAE